MVDDEVQVGEILGRLGDVPHAGVAPVLEGFLEVVGNQPFVDADIPDAGLDGLFIARIDQLFIVQPPGMGNGQNVNVSK